MANTSPRHMPVLGNVHLIKIENFDIFSWRHFSARSSFILLIDAATQEVPMKNILKKLSVQFLRYAIELFHGGGGVANVRGLGLSCPGLFAMFTDRLSVCGGEGVTPMWREAVFAVLALHLSQGHKSRLTCRVTCWGQVGGGGGGSSMYYIISILVNDVMSNWAYSSVVIDV